MNPCCFDTIVDKAYVGQKVNVVGPCAVVDGHVSEVESTHLSVECPVFLGITITFSDIARNQNENGHSFRPMGPGNRFFSGEGVVVVK